MNYDLSNFHPNCAGKSIVADSGHVFIYCPVCGIVADVEAVSAKVSPKDIAAVGSKDRTPTGKQSAGLDKGGVL